MIKSEGNLTTEWLEKYGDPNIEISINVRLGIGYILYSSTNGLDRSYISNYLEISEKELDSITFGIENIKLSTIKKIQELTKAFIISCTVTK